MSQPAQTQKTCYTLLPHCSNYENGPLLQCGRFFGIGVLRLLKFRKVSARPDPKNCHTVLPHCSNYASGTLLHLCLDAHERLLDASTLACLISLFTLAYSRGRGDSKHGEACTPRPR